MRVQHKVSMVLLTDAKSTTLMVVPLPNGGVLSKSTAQKEFLLILPSKKMHRYLLDMLTSVKLMVWCPLLNQRF